MGEIRSDEMKCVEAGVTTQHGTGRNVGWMNTDGPWRYTMGRKRYEVLQSARSIQPGALFVPLASLNESKYNHESGMTTTTFSSGLVYLMGKEHFH